MTNNINMISSLYFIICYLQFKLLSTIIPLKVYLDTKQISV